MLTKIPFSGFYNSIHDDALTQAVSDLSADDHGDPQIEDLYDHVNWGKLCIDYSKLYLAEFNDYFADKTGIKLRARFDELSSPREYNFTTDRIFANISQRTVLKLWKAVDKKRFAAAVKDQFTSYDGFISFYSPYAANWGDVRTWDHNQVWKLLETVLLQSADENWEYEVYENIEFCNTYDSLTPEGKRMLDELWKKQRAERYFQTHQMTFSFA